MNRQRRSCRKRLRKGVAARGERMSFAGQPGLSTSHGAALRTQKYRQLVRQHFDRLLGRLFINVTGLHFHIVWVPAPPHEWQSRTLPTTCSVCCRLRGLPLPPECRACGPRPRLRAQGGERRPPIHVPSRGSQFLASHSGPRRDCGHRLLAGAGWFSCQTSWPEAFRPSCAASRAGGICRGRPVPAAHRFARADLQLG